MKWYLIIFLINFTYSLKAQSTFNDKFNSFRKIETSDGVIITFDEPTRFYKSKKTKLIIFALPNGNTTAQTYGKKLSEGDDWHFDIQHIGAQTAFIRNIDQFTNYVVVYVENRLKSWPSWRKQQLGSDEKIFQVVELIAKRYATYHPRLTLSAHSGGGSFIFGYLNSRSDIDADIERIGFLDATYAYATESHKEKFNLWLRHKKNSLQIISYNDSVVIYNGKPLVSPTGGTWYRSKLIISDLRLVYPLKTTELNGEHWFHDDRHRISIRLVKNPEAKIYHTMLVEKNGFIDLIFNGTGFQQKQYSFWNGRAYGTYILE